MKKLFVRLAASGAIVASLGAPALAADVSIHATGPDSTNTVTSTNHSSWNSTSHNRVGLGNWNSQQAESGHVSACGNTWAGGALSSGSAYNNNATSNMVGITNHTGGFGGFTSPSGGHAYSIHLTGPDSYNATRSGNHNEFNQANYNSVGISNQNHQSATSGDVTLSRNTIVEGGGSSGDATNINSTQNNVSVHNSSPSFSTGSNSGGTAGIGLTGPGSYNSIKSNNRSETNITNYNNVGISNSNHQSANTGDVTVSRNTSVDGGGHSGDATNANHTQNTVGLNN